MSKLKPLRKRLLIVAIIASRYRQLFRPPTFFRPLQARFHRPNLENVNGCVKDSPGSPYRIINLVLRCFGWGFTSLEVAVPTLEMYAVVYVVFSEPRPLIKIGLCYFPRLSRTCWEGPGGLGCAGRQVFLGVIIFKLFVCEDIHQRKTKLWRAHKSSTLRYSSPVVKQPEKNLGTH